LIKDRAYKATLARINEIIDEHRQTTLLDELKDEVKLINGK
jgi:hypothetical protein